MTITVDLNEAIMINTALIAHLEAKWEKSPTGTNEYNLYAAKDNQAALIAKRDAN